MTKLLLLLAAAAAARTHAHLPLLLHDPRLDRAAQHKVIPPARRGALNEAWGEGLTPGGAVKGWLESPPHRRILLGHWKRTGVAIIYLRHQTLYIEVFL